MDKVTVFKELTAFLYSVYITRPDNSSAS